MKKILLSFALLSLCLNGVAKAASPSASQPAEASDDFVRLKNMFETSTTAARVGDFPEMSNTKGYKCAYVFKKGPAALSPNSIAIYRVTRVDALPDRGPLFPATSAFTDPIVTWELSMDEEVGLVATHGASVVTEKIEQPNNSGSVLRTTWFRSKDGRVTDEPIFILDMKLAGPYVVFHNVTYAQKDTVYADYYGYCWRTDLKQK